MYIKNITVNNLYSYVSDKAVRSSCISLLKILYYEYIIIIPFLLFLYFHFINFSSNLGYLRITDLGIARIWKPDNS